MEKVKNTFVAVGVLSLALVACSPFEKEAEEDATLASPVKIGVAHCCSDKDVFMGSLLDAIKKTANREAKVQIQVENAQDNQDTQLQQLKNLIAAGNQALVVSTVDTDPTSETGKKIISLAQDAKIPIVFYNHGVGSKALLSYDKAYYVGSIAAQSGLFQGELVIKNWGKNPQWDKNKDGVIQYVLLKGPNGHPDAEGRTKWVAATIENYPDKGIKAERLRLGVAGWQRDKAHEFMNEWLEKPDADKIELVIANNDDMAMGAVDSLKEHNLQLPAFGVDATADAISMVKSGDMAGTIQQNGQGQGQEALKLAINLAAHRSVTTGVDYKVIEQKISIPYVAIDADNVDEFLK